MKIGIKSVCCQCALLSYRNPLVGLIVTVKPENGLKRRQEEEDNVGASRAVCGYSSIQISRGVSAVIHNIVELDGKKYIRLKKVQLRHSPLIVKVGSN